mmetsp:Transcript_35301/g.59837  ORF Transcript_35301/g.59837 Transcript_35301/m.59837 type:complete len:851 (+) Transcript_35301:69-2621(+)
MPLVRGLERYLRERGLFHQGKISSNLQNATIAIDGYHWMKTCTDIGKEAMQPVVSSTALRTQRMVDGAVNQLLKAGAKCTFVFSGIPATPLNPPRVYSNQEVLKKRQEAWRALRQGNDRTAAALFSESHNFLSQAQVDKVRESIQTNPAAAAAGRGDRPQVDVLTAPSNSFAQLFWMEVNGYADCVFAPLEALQYPIRFLITKIDSKTGAIEWVEAKQVLASLNLDHAKFLDLCLLAGRHPCPTFEAVQTHPKRFFFKNAHEAILKKESGEKLIQAFLEKDSDEEEGQDIEEYLSTFRRVKSSISSCPIVSFGCKLKSINSLANERMRSECYGLQLPRLVLQLLGQGVLWPRSLSPIVLGFETTHPPFVDSEEAVKLYETLLKIRMEGYSMGCNGMLALLKIQQGNGATQSEDDVKNYAKSIAFRSWFAPTTPSLIALRSSSSSSSSSDENEFLSLPSSSMSSSAADSLCLTTLLSVWDDADAAHADDDEGARGNKETNNDKDNRVVVAAFIKAVKLKLFKVFGVIDTAGRVTELGERIAACLVKGYEKQKDNEDHDDNSKRLRKQLSSCHLENLLVLSILDKAGCIHGSPITLVAPGRTQKIFFDSKTRQESKGLRLASRLASFVQCQVNDEKLGSSKGGRSGWRGPVDRELAAFREMLEMAWNTCQIVTQNALIAQLACDFHHTSGGLRSGQMSASRVEAISSLLPFKNPPQAFGGIFVKTALEVSWNLSSRTETISEAQKALPALAKGLPTLSNNIGLFFNVARRYLSGPSLQESHAAPDDRKIIHEKTTSHSHAHGEHCTHEHVEKVKEEKEEDKRQNDSSSPVAAPSLIAEAAKILRSLCEGINS